MPTYSVGKIFQLVLLCARPPFQRDANEDGVHTVLFVRMRRLEWFTRYQPQGKRLNSWKRSRTVCSVTVFTSCEIGAHVEVSTYPVNLSWRNEGNIRVNSRTHLRTRLWLGLRSDSMKTTDTLSLWSKNRIFQRVFSMISIALNFVVITCNDFSFLFHCRSLRIGNYWLQSTKSAVHFWLEKLLSLNVGFLNQKDC